MRRLSICLLVALAVSLPGCETPGPTGYRNTEDVNRADFWEKPGADARPAGTLTVWRWMDEHPGIVCGFAGLLALGGIVVLTGLAAHSISAQVH